MIRNDMFQYRSENGKGMKSSPYHESSRQTNIPLNWHQIKCTGFISIQSEYWISTEKYLLGSPCFVNLQYSNSQLNSFRYARLWVAEVQVYDRFLLLCYLLAEGLYVMLAESGSNYSVMIKSEDRDVCLYRTLFSWHIWIFFIRIFRLKLPQLYLRLVIILYVDSESRE